MHNLRRFTLLAGLFLCAAGTTPDPQPASQVQLGRYLATVGNCAACHTAPGGPPFAGGRPIATPVGVIVSPNITPDRETGIGGWSDEDFVATMQRGIARHGKHLYPAMPYQYFTHVTPSDDLAIRAWLATVPAARNKVVSNRLAFPFGVRAGMAAWNRLFFTPGPAPADPAQGADWNRGAYLVNGLGHCGACHTPKTALGADNSARFLQGARQQGWFAPNITNDGRGLGQWSAEDVVSYLHSGHNRFATASGPMADEVSLSTSQLSEADLRAVATYLKALPGQGGTEPPLEASAAPMREGAAIYADACAACHTSQGKGAANVFPALSDAPTVEARQPAAMIRVVLEGARSGAAMPAFGWVLSDAQVAAVVTYVRNSWGNAAPAVAADEVRGERDNLAESLAQGSGQ